MPNWTTHGQWQTRANACKGEYRPVVYKVRVDDEFAQWRYRLATTALWGQGVRVEEFFWLCVEYVIRHHRKLAAVRREIREERRRRNCDGGRKSGSGRRAPRTGQTLACTCGSRQRCRDPGSGRG